MKRREFLRSAALIPAIWAFSPIINIDEGIVFVRILWALYKGRFIQDDGRVIEHSAAARSTSESLAYSMFHSIVNNDRDSFLRLLDWTRNNLCQGDMSAHLPAWLWGNRKDGSWGIIDLNNATDADLIIIYCLRQAGLRWNEPSWLNLAHKIGDRLCEECAQELPGLGITLLPGSTGFSKENGWRLNPSYCMLPIMNDFAHTWPESKWPGLFQSARLLLIKSAGSKSIAPDWILWDKGGHPQPETIGSYDAIRVYLWAALSKDSEIISRYQGIIQFAKSGTLPEDINTMTGIPNGTGPTGFSAAILPYLKALSNDNAYKTQYQRVLNDIAKDPQIKNLTYYDMNLILFGLGAVKGAYSFNSKGILA